MLRARAGNGPEPGRRPHLLSAILFPTGPTDSVENEVVVIE